MCTMRSLVYFFFLLVIVQVFVYYVDGVPLKKATLNTTQKLSRNTTKIQPTKSIRSTKKPTGRDGRFLGKFTFLAGLGLPDPSPVPISHRDDIILSNDQNEITTTPYVASHNFPPSRWGPYFAAVYEPSPIVTFFENNWNYLAAFLNPYNWFSGGGESSNISGNHVNSPEIISTVLPDNDSKDIVVIVHDADNEIPNDDHEAFDAKMEMKIEQASASAQKYQKIMDAITSESLIAASTLAIDDRETTDLIAEESTSKIIETDPDPYPEFEEQTESITPMVVEATKPTQKTKTTKNPFNNPKSTTIINTPEEPPLPPTTVTEMITATTSGNLGINGTNQTTTNVVTTQTPVTYPGFHNGYYYGGYPQNIGHVEFTTPPPVTMNTMHPARIFNFNSIDYPNNYYQQDNQPNFDYYSRVDQSPPESFNYQHNANQLRGGFENDFDLHGFKPSFPLIF